MRKSFNNILMSKKEVKALVHLLLSILILSSNLKTIFSVATGFHRVAIEGKPVYADQLAWYRKFAADHRMAFPSFKEGPGLYYRNLYDASTSTMDREAAIASWDKGIRDTVRETLYGEWVEDPLRLINKMRAAGVDPEIIQEYAAYIQSVIPEYRVPGADIELGKLRVISA